ncbi:MAG: hypothetical protein AABX64_00420 [Nanoarchaeota archaeon]
MKKMMTGLSLLISGCYTIYKPQTHQFDNYGQEIIFVVDPDNPHGATASYEKATDGKEIPVIKYNPDWIGWFSEEFQNFLFYHEIAHFKLGHLDNWNPYVSQEELYELQREADCTSVIYLHNLLRYTPDQFMKIYEAAFVELERERVDDLMACPVK